MARRNTGLNTIDLNGTSFPIVGRVSPSLISTLPGKIVIGDYSLADQQIASEWVINDQRAGLGIEEMDESIHQDRYLLSTCNARHKGNLTLNPLITQADLPDKTDVPIMVNGDMEIDGVATPLTGGWNYGSYGTRSSTQKNNGTYSLKVTGFIGTVTIPQYLEGWTPGCNYTFTCDTYGLDANGKCRIQIADGTQTVSSAYNTTAAWVSTNVVITVASTATYLKLTLQFVSDENTDLGYFDIAAMQNTSSAGATAYGAPGAWANFNSELYLAVDDTLTILNDAGDGFNTLYQFPATITDLYVGLHVASGLSYLAILLGDDDAYWYLGTNFSINGIAQSDVANQNLGISWDEKAMAVSTTGQMYDSVGLAAASPSWNTDGKLRLDDNAINSLEIYRDSDADPQVYAGTKSGLWIHDFTNDKWIETELSLPDHELGGKGLVNWRDAIYNSSGLHVDKYVAGQTATVASVGLDRDDGLPVEFNGEITKFIDGHNQFHAAVDSSQVTGTGYSGLYDYNGSGWHCIWVGATSDDTMVSGIESSVTSYRLWFDHNSLVYYVPLLRGIQSPVVFLIMY